MSAAICPEATKDPARADGREPIDAARSDRGADNGRRGRRGRGRGRDGGGRTAAVRAEAPGGPASSRAARLGDDAALAAAAAASQLCSEARAGRDAPFPQTGGAPQEGHHCCSTGSVRLSSDVRYSTRKYRVSTAIRHWADDIRYHKHMLSYAVSGAPFLRCPKHSLELC